VAQLNAVTAQSNNFRTYNNGLLRIANVFYTRFQVQEEDGHALRGELREIVSIIREVKIPRFRFTGTSIAILFTNFC
jgi:hypothetical protein